MSRRPGKRAFQAMVDLAREAQQRAHAPYSGFKVGSALRTRSGEIVTTMPPLGRSWTCTGG